MAASPLLHITNLHAMLESEQKAILNGLSLTVNPGEVHAIMGPNGAGKSTLAAVLAGKPGYAVTQGNILYHGEDIAEQAPDERARNGIFMAFQYPVELPGVNAAQFLRAIVNAQRAARAEEPLDAAEFLRRARAEMSQLEMDHAFLQRAVNVGFSGGEKKRFDMLQAALLQPQLLVLDETDSGLDIDALRAVAGGINALRSPQRSIILITHYQRLLDYVTPDHVHILAAGKIVRSGGAALAQQLEASGYAGLTA